LADSANLSDRTEPASAEQRSLLERYLELLYSESNRLNLTRVPRQQAWGRHIEESLDLLPLRNWASGERVLDLGSGGGIPGIPLAIVQVELSVVLVERDRAKAAFLLSCLGQLELPSVQVVARDSVELSGSRDFVPADVLVSRAAVPVLQLLRGAGSLLRAGGEGLVHVGKSVALDDVLAAAGQRAGLGDLRVEIGDHSRILRFVRLGSA
jgi:16S rRNA (guanine527-N7)-methyltransferase